MPEGYDPIQQVLTNSLINVYVPRFKRAALPTLAGLLALAALVFVVRRRRRNTRQ